MINAFYVDNKVVLRLDMPVPKYVKVGGKEYVFSVRHSVSLLFVPEEDAPSLLAVKGGCCGKQKQIITLANEATYKHWLDGNGGRN